MKDDPLQVKDDSLIQFALDAANIHADLFCNYSQFAATEGSDIFALPIKRACLWVNLPERH